MNPETTTPDPRDGAPADDVDPAAGEVPVPTEEALSRVPSTSDDAGTTSDGAVSTSDDVSSTSDDAGSTSEDVAATSGDGAAASDQVAAQHEPAAAEGEPAAAEEEPDAYRMRRGVTESAGPVPDDDLRSAVEAILLVVDTPVAEVTLAQVLERPIGDVTAALTELAEEYSAQSRGMDLRRAAGGWRLYTRSEYAPYVERFVLDGQQARLTQAALETLSVVAYRQPVTRSRISAIRGVGVDGVIRTLVTRGLIEEAGAEHETGAHLYRTTTLFLEKLGLNSLDELPSLAPLLPEIEALDDVIGSP
ncbi:MAG: putative transcriptional regulator [Mycobacterium sp.]|nr:putative transcriptional regulator [Mycobacterium sp.]